MTLIARALPLLLLVSLVAVIPAAVRAEASASQPSLPTLVGFVGPGYDISIRDSEGDLRGRTIPAGTYQVTIHDYSSIHNFELKGDGSRRGDRRGIRRPGHMDGHLPARGRVRVRVRSAPRLHVRRVPRRLWASAASAAPTAAPASSGRHAECDRHRRVPDQPPPSRRSAVTSLQAGQYTIQVNDQTDQHNFHLTGPGGVNNSTAVAFVGTQTWTVSFVPGTYNYVCDPHSGGMFGSFTVTSGGPPPPPPLLPRRRHRHRHRHRHRRRLRLHPRRAAR